MRRLGLLLVVALTGCINFDDARDRCIASGRCQNDATGGGLGTGGGVSTGGGTQATGGSGGGATCVLDLTNPRADADCDGLSDVHERGTTYVGGAQTDPCNDDTDDDGLIDGLEVGVATVPTVCSQRQKDADPKTMTNPTVFDTDGDGLRDGAEDLNANGMVDDTESDPLRQDTDCDGLSDKLEAQTRCTLAREPDTDFDGLLDGEEAPPDQLPLDPACDYPSLGPTAAGSRTRTNPCSADTDSDSLIDGAEDTNHDGHLNAGETDPTVANTGVNARMCVYTEHRAHSAELSLSYTRLAEVVRDSSQNLLGLSAGYGGFEEAVFVQRTTTADAVIGAVESALEAGSGSAVLEKIWLDKRNDPRGRQNRMVFWYVPNGNFQSAHQIITFTAQRLLTRAFPSTDHGEVDIPVGRLVGATATQRSNGEVLVRLVAGPANVVDARALFDTYAFVDFDDVQRVSCDYLETPNTRHSDTLLLSEPVDFSQLGSACERFAPLDPGANAFALAAFSQASRLPWTQDRSAFVASCQNLSTSTGNVLPPWSTYVNFAPNNAFPAADVRQVVVYSTFDDSQTPPTLPGAAFHSVGQSTDSQVAAFAAQTNGVAIGPLAAEYSDAVLSSLNLTLSAASGDDLKGVPRGYINCRTYTLGDTSSSVYGGIAIVDPAALKVQRACASLPNPDSLGVTATRGVAISYVYDQVVGDASFCGPTCREKTCTNGVCTCAPNCNDLCPSTLRCDLTDCTCKATAQ